MLKVTIELHPYGSRERSVVLREFDIVNDHTDRDTNRAEYTMWTDDGAWDVANIQDWDRSRPVEELVIAMLQSYITSNTSAHEPIF